MIRYRKAVLIIHGFAGGTYDEEPLLFYLQSDLEFDVYNFTLPGHSTNLSSDISYKDWLNSVDDKINFLKAKGYQKIYLVGHSMGGVLATHAAIKHKEIKKLVLVAPAFRYLSMTDNVVAKVLMNGPDVVKTYQAKEVVSRALKVSVNQLKEFMKLVDISGHNPEFLNVPTLIIQGLEDQIVPPDSSFEIQKRMKCNNHLLTLTGVNHDVFESAKVNIINAEIKKFLKAKKYKADSIRKW